MQKIKVFIDYPTSETKEFKGLSFPQVLYDFLKTQDNIQLVKSSDKFDVLFIISGGSHYASRNNYYNPKYWLSLIKEKFCGKQYVSKNYDKHLSPNSYYEKRIKRLLKKNPNAKIIHRLDDRYRMLCKAYGYDDTVQKINKLADATVFQTEYCKSLYTKGVKTIFGFEKPYKIKSGHLLMNGVDTEVFNPEGDRFELKGKIKIFHVATTGMTRKGLGTVLEFANILKDNPDIHFYLIGKQEQDPIFGNDIEKFENVSKIEQINDRYLLAKYYRSGDILLYPTINDCSSNVILEAMSCGMPVVAANSGGSPELIIKQDLKGGILINDKNPIYALKECIENLDLFKIQAVELIKKYHSKEVMGEKYLNLILSLTEEKNN